MDNEEREFARAILDRVHRTALAIEQVQKDLGTLRQAVEANTVVLASLAQTTGQRQPQVALTRQPTRR